MPDAHNVPAVHLRTCGEHSCPHLLLLSSVGSSPHVRRTLHLDVCDRVVVRFISARVGNTAMSHAMTCATPVHPRTRGEHRARPRAILKSARFIPARAGNTPELDLLEVGHAVHPRTRGEHMTINIDSMVENGSSPHARGTPRAGGDGRLQQRFIPARAGNTRRSSSRTFSIAVHPRTRGEHSHITRNGRSASGSSPHARGTLRASKG